MPAYVTVTLRLPVELAERVDEARRAQSRNGWLVTAVDMALANPAQLRQYQGRGGAVERALEGPVGSTDPVAGDPADERPAPAEQPEPLASPENVKRADDLIRSGVVRPAREFKPYPKPGKR